MEQRTARKALLEHIASKSLAVEQERVVVAIDGVDGSGKTHFADELAAIIAAHGGSVVRASVDGFHNPRDVRYQRGQESPEGYFLDSYDYDALKRHLLLPFRSGASGVQTARFDHNSNQQVTSSFVELETNSILLVDGIFLHRDELVSSWDLSVFLHVPFATSYMRMADRDGSDSDPQASENYRYLEGQRIYLKRCNPHARATVVIDNTDLHEPQILCERTTDIGG